MKITITNDWFTDFDAYTDEAKDYLEVGHVYDVNELVHHESWIVRREAASHGYGLDKLMYDEYEDVCEEVAKYGYGLDKFILSDNIFLYKAAEYYLDDNNNSSIFEWAEANPDKRATTDKIDIDEWLNSDDWYKRLAVARAGYGLNKLVNDENADVRQAVAEQGYGLDKLINDTDGGYMVYWYYHNIKSSVEAYLSKNGYNSIFEWAEANPDKVVTDLNIDEWLNSDDGYKRIEVAKQGYGLDKLISDTSSKVRDAVANYLKDHGYKSIEDWAKANPDKVHGTMNTETTDHLKDFVYKIDDSNSLKIESSYESVDAFFNDNSKESYESNEALIILAVDTKVPLIKLEKSIKDNKQVYKFIVDITNENGDDFRVRSIINTKEKFNELLISTINSLKEFSQFNKYAEELENCL